MRIAFEVIRRYELEDYVKLLYSNNEAAFSPYHNFCHGLSVLKYAEIISRLLNTTGVSKQLAIACLFHDFNHSAGKETDAWNVQTAIISMTGRLKPKHLYMMEDVAQIIQATQYPYVVDRFDLTYEQAIIRDADLLQMIDGNYIQRIAIPLCTEMKWNIDEFRNAQTEFLNNIQFCFTESGTLFEVHKHNILEQITDLADILTYYK